MLVKDLIYLLQTRGKPDDEVWIANLQDLVGQISDTFTAIETENLEYPSGKIEGICKIFLDTDQLENFCKRHKKK